MLLVVGLGLGLDDAVNSSVVVLQHVCEDLLRLLCRLRPLRRLTETVRAMHLYSEVFALLRPDLTHQLPGERRRRVALADAATVIVTLLR